MFAKTKKLLIAPVLRSKGFFKKPTEFMHAFKRGITLKRALLVSGAGLVLLAVSYAGLFFWPRTIVFSFAGDNCFVNPVLLPNLISDKQSPLYRASPKESISVVGYPVYAHKTCVSPKNPPKERAAETIAFGKSFFRKNIQVSTGAFPSLANAERLEKPITTEEPLTLQLNKTDYIFDYRLQVDEDRRINCNKRASSLSCDITKLKLAQSKQYHFKLERLFQGTSAGAMFRRSLATVKKVQVKASSLQQNETIYNVPKKLTLSLNRAVVSAEGAKLELVSSDKRQNIPITTKLDGKQLTVSFDKPLRRSASFVFSVQRVTAADGGFLSKPFSLKFNTSGGPKVLGINIGTYKTSVNPLIALDLDVAASKDDVGKYVRLVSGGKVLAATVSVQDSNILISPRSALPRCAAFTVEVMDGLKNQFGVAGGSGWRHNSRTLCQTVFSIGTSVQGRSIVAYQFGSGNSEIVFVGGMHGDEKSSVYVLNQWVEELEASGNIPARRTITIIPNLNPDGFAMSRRTNARNVDLNRNFAANDWRSDVDIPGMQLKQGGGKKPLSEPESAALASYIIRQSPRLVLTYHAAVGIVMPNGSGDSDKLARLYAQKSNLAYSGLGQENAIFNYNPSGELEAWLHDKIGIPTLLLELWTLSGYEFSGNKDALWSIVNLP